MHRARRYLSCHLAPNRKCLLAILTPHYRDADQHAAIETHCCQIDDALWLFAHNDASYSLSHVSGSQRLVVWQAIRMESNFVCANANFNTLALHYAEMTWD